MAGKAGRTSRHSLLFAGIALTLNALVLPGLGSLIAGKFSEGAVQVGLEILSMLVIAVGAFFSLSFLLPMGVALAIILFGMAFGFAAWAWGIMTGVRLVVESGKAGIEGYGL